MLSCEALAESVEALDSELIDEAMTWVVESRMMCLSDSEHSLLAYRRSSHWHVCSSSQNCEY